MSAERPTDDDGQVTLRAPRLAVALVIALILHATGLSLAGLIPSPKPAPKRIEFTFASSPPPAPPPMVAAAPAPKHQRVVRSHASPPPVTSPVLPELAPTEHPEEHVQLPIVERSPEPAPPPKATWKTLLAEALGSSGPVPKAPTGELVPSFATLARVANADPRMHDEENERRMMEDHGAFFRRGLEALRGNWHPDEVLNAANRSRERVCGRTMRTTFAVAVIDRAGNVVDVDLKSPSGCDELDDEAVAAFKRVAQFPHPPAGIFVAPDGEPMETARYPVRFIVTFDGGIQIDWRG